MKAQTTIGILVATALALAAASAVAQGRHGQGGASPPQRAQVERGQRDFDRDRVRDRDRVNDPAMDRKQDRKQDRTNGPENGDMTKQRQMTQNQQGQMKQQGQMNQNQQGQMNQNQQGQMNQEGIYGGELMSEQERNQYREQLRLTDSDPEQQTRFKAQHQEKMQKRAQEKGVKLPDPPADDSGD